MICIISSPEDIHAQAVIRELAKQGVSDAYLFNLADFPMRMSLAMRIGRNGSDRIELKPQGRGAIPLGEIRAFWWRRPQGFGIPASVSDPASRHFAMSEAATAFQGIWQSSQALWVNNILRDAAAAHKPWQLAVAKEIGLSIPETLITNDPSEAKEFWDHYPGQVIYKPFTASLTAWRETRLLRPEEKAFAEAVRLAPVIFQRYVPAVVDLRITVIGQRLFSAEADTQKGEYQVDVRLNRDIPYKAHQLPEGVQQQLLALMRKLGLEYGAIDMRLTPESEYVFLEINPAGQFLYVEMATGLPISAALAEHLAQAGKS